MPGSGLFINYRHADSSGYAGRIRDHLVPRFGSDQVFMDVGILGGEDWIASIERALSGSVAVLAVIGPRWSSERLEDPGDRLRQELEAALRLGVVIIPVLVADARMPRDEDLPASLRPLTRHQAVRLTDQGWDDDVRRLVVRLEQLVLPPKKGREDASEPEPVRAPQGRSRAKGVAVTGIVLAIVAGAGLGIFALVSQNPNESDGSPPSRTLAVTLPPRDAVYNQLVDEAVKQLEDAGLAVRTEVIGCSNSTQPGFVRQVTVGPNKNEHIIYGKSTDELDQNASESLSRGDEVTVWYPNAYPCP